MARQRRARVIAVANQKGGVGKTTTTLNLGAELAASGKHVLIVDLDPQADLTFGLFGDTGEEASRPNLYTALTNQSGNIRELIQPSQWQGLDILPGTLDMAGFDMFLAPKMGRENVLKNALAELIADYDYILLDCGPSLGLITVNALVAARWVLIPVQAEPRSVRATGRMIEAVEQVRVELSHPRLQVLGLILTMAARNKVSDEAVQSLRGGYNELVFDTVVSRRVKLAEDTLYQAPLREFAPRSESAVEMQSLAVEMVERIRKAVTDAKR